MIRPACALLACAAPCVIGCSLLLEPKDSQCEQAQDCSALGFSNAVCENGLCQPVPEPTGPWRCVGRLEPVAPDPTQPIQVPAVFQRMLGRTPLVGMEIFTCRPFDPSCSEPYASVKTDENGKADIPVYRGFDGHGFIPGDFYAGMMPALFFFVPPPEGTTDKLHGTLPLASFAEMEMVIGMIDRERVPGTGHFLFTVFDCDGERAAGASVTLDSSSDELQPFYISNNGIPDPSLTSTSPKGEGAIINIPPGTVNVSVSTVEQGLIARATLIIAPDSFTGVPIYPTPL